MTEIIAGFSSLFRPGGLDETILRSMKPLFVEREDILKPGLVINLPNETGPPRPN
ncbi:MAG: hypothetical protein JSS22_12420 [Proteobacteria bacterium]|nr:hypothetical protein [Pseudomonadota bacterium]